MTRHRLDIDGKLLRGAWASALNPERRQELLDRCALQTLRLGQVLWRQGDMPCGFYAVTSGGLKVSTFRRDGREAILAVLGPGDWFGEAALITRTVVAHDTTSVEESCLLRLDAAGFAEMLRDVDFHLAISRLMASRINSLYAEIEDGCFRTEPPQVARRLLRLARGDIEPSSACSPRIRVSHETLATMLGISRQTLAKQLRCLVQAGCIHQQYGFIEIRSFSALESLALSA